MPATFMVGLGPDGMPEPNFCSVCQEYPDAVVYFLSGRIEVSMCLECVTAAGQLLLDAHEREADSQARP